MDSGDFRISIPYWDIMYFIFDSFLYNNNNNNNNNKRV